MKTPHENLKKKKSVTKKFSKKFCSLKKDSPNMP